MSLERCLWCYNPKGFIGGSVSLILTHIQTHTYLRHTDTQNIHTSTLAQIHTHTSTHTHTDKQNIHTHTSTNTHSDTHTQKTLEQRDERGISGNGKETREGKGYEYAQNILCT